MATYLIHSPTKVTFIGIHYKPGKTALDSTTLSGKRIDQVIEKLEAKCQKRNLFSTTFLPTTDVVKDSIIQSLKRRIADDGILVLLGKQVQEFFPYKRYDKAKIIKANHPAYPKGHTAAKEYIEELSTQINNVLKN